jgi:hypothetical protein
MKQIGFALCGYVLSVSVLAQTAPDSPVAEGPKYRVGDAWVLEAQTDGGPKRNNSRTVLSVNDDGETSMLEDRGSRGKFVSVHSPARPLAGQFFQYDESAPGKRGPPVGDATGNQPYLTFPLSVGKKWSFKASFRHSNGEFGENEFDAEVRSFEKVSVAAGEFDAFKILLKGFWNNRSWAIAGASGQMTIELWYAPAAKAVIFRQTKALDYRTMFPIFLETVEAISVKTTN